MSDTGTTFVAHLGRDAAARCAPRTVFAGGSFATRAGITRQPIGSMGRAASGFGRVLGLSQVQRWSMEDHAPDELGDAAVRPPIDYWPFADGDAAIGAASRREAEPAVVTPRSPASSRGRVDRVEALRRMLTKGSKSSDATTGARTSTPSGPAARAAHRAPTGRAPSHRGLPITMRRQGRTWAGPGTAPGRTSATSAPQSTGSVPAARVEPTRAQRSERSAGTDGAKEERRGARDHGTRTRPRSARRTSTQPSEAMGSIGADNSLVLAALSIEPPIALSELTTNLAHAPEPAATVASRAPSPSADIAERISAPAAEGVQRTPAQAKRKGRRSSTPEAPADVAPSGPEATDVVVPDGRSDDVALTRSAPLPSTAHEPLTRAEGITSRSAEPLKSATNESAVPLVALADLPVEPNAAAAAAAAAEAALASRPADAAPASARPSARVAADPTLDTRTTADVLRPIPLATVARRSAVAPGRPVAPAARLAIDAVTQSAIGLPSSIAAPSTIGAPSAAATLSTVAAQSAVQMQSTFGPLSAASMLGQTHTVAADHAPAATPMRIGDARRVRVQRTPDGRAVVWNAPPTGHGMHSPSPDGARADDPGTGVSAAALATVADAVPTVARSLDRALQDEAPFQPETRTTQGFTGTIEAPLRARPPMAVPAAERTLDDASSQSSTPTPRARPDSARPESSRVSSVEQAASAAPVQRAVAGEKPTVAAAKQPAPAPPARASAANRNDWVPASPGSLLGVNLLRRRPLHVDRAVGALPSLERATSPVPAETATGVVAPAATLRHGEQSASVSPDLSTTPTVRRAMHLEDARPIDLVSDAAVAPRAVPVVRRDLGGHAVTAAATVAATPSATAVSERLQRSAAIGRTDRPVAGSPRAQATDLAERFLAELVRHRDERPTELPTVFRSIADVIVGDRRPLVSTSAASRRALAAVGKQAATTGDVIHLARPLSGGAPSGELAAVMAHELTHVASPSPEPRFFDDDRDSAEERRAHQVGELMRTAPLAPRVIGASMTAQRTLDSGFARPSSDPGGTTAGGGTTTSASGLAARLTGDGSPDTIRRSPSISTSSSANVIRREKTLESEGVESESESTMESSSGRKKDFEAQLREHFDLIVDLLEERIIVDLERRGGRFRGGLLMSLQKAFLEPEKGPKIECMFNPAKFGFSVSNRWESDTVPGKSSPTLRFAGGSGGSFSLSLVFDTTATGQPVTTYTTKLLKLMKVDTTLQGYEESRNNGRPPWVKFRWGTQIHTFKAIIKSMDITFTYFASDGKPLRANVEMSLEQFEPAENWGPQNPTSGTPTPNRTHQVRVGDTLDRIAAEYYGSPTKWRGIAAVNGIADPLELRPGTLIAIPESAD